MIENLSVNFTARPQNKKTKKGRSGTLVALLGATIAQTAITKASLPLAMNLGMTKLSLELSKDQVILVNTATDKILTDVTNLGEKGVEIVDAGVAKMRTKSKRVAKTLKATKAGKNAFFEPNLNKIFVNREKFSLATFHELGHAFNFNNSRFWKYAQKLRTPGIVFASAFTLLPALTKNSKAKEGEELTRSQKFKNKLRKLSPALAFVSMMPMLAEEGMASIRGCKWAKKLLDPSLYKKVLKTNIVAYGTYLASAIACVVAASVAKNIKDKAQQKAQYHA